MSQSFRGLVAPLRSAVRLRDHSRAAATPASTASAMAPSGMWITVSGAGRSGAAVIGLPGGIWISRRPGVTSTPVRDGGATDLGRRPAGRALPRCRSTGRAEHSPAWQGHCAPYARRGTPGRSLPGGRAPPHQHTGSSRARPPALGWPPIRRRYVLSQRAHAICRLWPGRTCRPRGGPPRSHGFHGFGFCVGERLLRRRDAGTGCVERVLGGLVGGIGGSTVLITRC
jgi:hypothetical protein